MSHHLSSPDKERITQIFFEEFGVPAFAIYDAGLLALYAAGVLTGITVDIGFEKTGNLTKSKLIQILLLSSRDRLLRMDKFQYPWAGNMLLNISSIS
jgi:hypothetical protein